MNYLALVWVVLLFVELMRVLSPLFATFGTRISLLLLVLTIFGYLTATLATFFVDREAAIPCPRRLD